MQKFVDLLNSELSGYSLDTSLIQSSQSCLDIEMKVYDWISFILSNRECVLLKMNNGVFLNQGFVVNDEKVLKVFGNHQIGAISYNEDTSVVEKGSVNLEHGNRFEGLVLTEKEGKIGIPFGYGEMYDNDGFLVYKGIMINWKRFGYGSSYHNNGGVEYEGYWCDDKRFGRGIVCDQYGKLVNECMWYNGIEGDYSEYKGNGSKPLSICIKHLKLTNNCILVDWDVSLLYNLESIEIGNECCSLVQTFRIDGLNRLTILKIGINSFTQKRNSFGKDESKSFHVLNCKSLKIIQISEYSFSDFGGVFELKNLPLLKFINFGLVGYNSFNFWYSSLVVRGRDMILCFIMIRSSKSTIHYFR